MLRRTPAPCRFALLLAALLSVALPAVAEFDLNAKYALDNADIGIPFPQRDIHVPGGITVRVQND